MPKGLKQWTIFVLAQFALTGVLKLVFKLADNALMGWGDDQIAAYFGIRSPTGAEAFNWGLPFVLAAVILFAYHVIHSWPHAKQRARYQDREIGLIETMWWVAEQSGWGRWQAAQSSDWSNEQRRFVAALSFFRMAALNGDVRVRARLKNSVEYADVDRDFWRSTYIAVQPDNAAIWKPVILPLGEIAIPDYDNFIIERNRVHMLWPRYSLEYEWAIFKLKLRAKLNRMKEKSPKVAEPPAEIKAIEAVPPPVQDANPEPVPAPRIFTPPSSAPNGWERLFVVGDDGRSVWLRFLPDTKNGKSDALLLIIYGQKILLGNNRIGIHQAHAAVRKTVDTSPSKSYSNQTSIFARMGVGLAMAAAFDDEDYAAKHLGSSLRRVGLSQGGMYELTATGEQIAANLAYDLIERA